MRHGRPVWVIPAALLALPIVAMLVACEPSTPSGSLSGPASPAPSGTTLGSPLATAVPSMSSQIGSLKTYPTREVGCDSLGVDHPVVGHLAAGSSDPSVLWLVAPDGQRLEVVWPAGFSARFAAQPELLDEQGHHAAFAGDMVYLQVPRASAFGTVDDPYYATGLVAAGHDLDTERPAEAPWVGCYGRAS
jgi:hypothetical protein